MPKETDEEFAKRLIRLANSDQRTAAIRARDREVAEEMRERAQKYLEKHGTGINSIAELNDALGMVGE
jgi:hypothetical protein